MVKEIGAIYLRKGDNWWYFKHSGKAIRLAKAEVGETKDKIPPRIELARAKYLTEMEFKTATTENNLDNKTVQELVDYYLYDYTSRLGKKTKKDRVTLLKKFCKKFGATEYRLLSKNAVSNWIDSVESWNEGGKCQAARGLKATFNALVKDEKITSNKLQWLRFPEPDARGEQYAISEEHYLMIMNASPTWFADIIRALWETGARPEEILGATCEEYIQKLRILRKHKHKTKKKGKTRDISLNDFMVKDIEARIQKHKKGKLYRGRDGGNPTSSHLGAKLKEILKETEIPMEERPFIIPYSFRHRWAVDALRSGMLEHDVAAFMGHQKVEVLRKHYSHTLETISENQSIKKLEAFREQKPE